MAVLSYKRSTRPRLPFLPTSSCDETSKYSAFFIRPSHLASVCQQSSIYLPLSSWTALLAWCKRIRHIGKPNISTASTPRPTCICMLSPISAFRRLFGCNRQLHEQWLAFRSTRSNAVHQFRDVHIPQQYYISMLFEHYLGHSVWTGKRTAHWCRCSIWERCSKSGQLRKET